jgi:hypothetical protein
MPAAGDVLFRTGSTSGRAVVSLFARSRCLFGSAGTGRRNFFAISDCRVARRLPSHRPGLSFGVAQFDAGSAGFGKPDGDGLLAGPDIPAALFELVHFLPDKFARLGGGLLALARIAPRPLDGGWLWHTKRPPLAVGGV